MNEAEWLAATDPRPMLKHLRDSCRSNERKLRLFTVASCRAVWPMLRNRDKESAVETAESYADGHADDHTLKRAADLAWQSGKPLYDPAKHLVKATTAKRANAGAQLAAEAWLGRSSAPRYLAEQCSLLRCIMGNPFRPAPAVDPAWLAWRGGAVRELARAAYDERCLPEGTLEPVRLAELADALEDAGCRDAELLGHLRGPGPHVRGCWAVDLVLGKG